MAQFFSTEEQTRFTEELNFAMSELAGYAAEFGPSVQAVELKPSSTGEWTWRLYLRGNPDWEGGVIRVKDPE